MNILVIAVDIHKPFRSNFTEFTSESLDQSVEDYFEDEEVIKDMLSNEVNKDDESLTIETEMYTYLFFNKDYEHKE